jgi:hypothetical protein
MRINILMRPLVAAVLTTTAVALAACGGDSPTGAPSADQRAKMQEAALKFARCMREHGVDVPDPKPGGGIQLAVPDGMAKTKVDAAQKACQKYMDAVKPPELSDEQQKQARDAALAFSRCMREHGIDFPDPQFGDKGEAKIHIDKSSGINPNDPKFQQAQKECQKNQPGMMFGEQSHSTGGSQ